MISAVFLCFFATSFVSEVESVALMSIDLGTEWLKIAVVSVSNTVFYISLYQPQGRANEENSICW